MSKCFKDKKDLMDFNNKGFVIRNKYLSAKNNSFNCSYTGCNCKGVNSHTISKESSLRHISENDKLLAFVAKRDKDANVTPRITEVGLNHATTFKGFCHTHEKLFTSIDSNGIITKNDLILQIYRQVAYSNYNCGILKSIDEHITARQLKDLKNIHKDVREHTIHKSILKEKEKKFKRGITLKELLNEFTTYLSTLNEYSPNLLNDEVFYIDRLSIKIYFKRINFVIPVSLINDFGFNNRGNITNTFFSVIPNGSSTDIIMVVDKHYESWADNLWLYYTQSHINILNFVEVIMMLSEFWFIKPSIIENMPDEKKDFLTSDIRYVNERTFGEYDFSIFDNIRKGFIFIENEEIQERELNKINIIPKRDSIDIRESRLTEYITKFY